MFDLPAVQRAIRECGVDGWLLYDFRGLNPKSFDGRGNYAMGLKEQIIFPEISYDQIGRASCRERV